MADRTAIEWTEATWNPVTGCSKVSPGCAHCYAERLAERFHGTKAWPNGFDVQLRPERMDQPVRWRRPRRIFVNSMSDLFHEAVPIEYIARVFDVISECSRHTFQILTKRHGRLVEVARQLNWPSNLWMGVSVENQRWTERVDALRQVPAQTRFLSVEPLVGPVDLDLTDIDWVIVGGESGWHARPMEAAWARSVRDQCQAAEVAFFFKQWGGKYPKAGGRSLDGREWNQMPNETAGAGPSPRLPAPSAKSRAHAHSS